MDSFKDDLALGFSTSSKTLELNQEVFPSLPIDLEESLSPPAKSLNTLVMKKLYYIMVFAEKVELKKKIVGDIGE